jgi:hypothetical protein
MIADLFTLVFNIVINIHLFPIFFRLILNFIEQKKKLSDQNRGMKRNFFPFFRQVAGTANFSNSDESLSKPRYLPNIFVVVELYLLTDGNMVTKEMIYLL